MVSLLLSTKIVKFSIYIGRHAQAFQRKTDRTYPLYNHSGNEELAKVGRLFGYFYWLFRESLLKLDRTIVSVTRWTSQQTISIFVKASGFC